MDSREEVMQEAAVLFFPFLDNRVKATTTRLMYQYNINQCNFFNIKSINLNETTESNKGFIQSTQQPATNRGV